MALAIGLCACVTTTPLPAEHPASFTLEDRLYLGGASPHGPVTEADWDRFVAEVVTPLFPGGLTLWRANGQWRSADGSIAGEPVLIIEILHSGETGTDARLATIAEAYRARFSQEAVLRATRPVRGRLIQ